MVGIFFMYIGILNELMVLVDIISILIIKLFMVGNFFCVVISNYGLDL